MNPNNIVPVHIEPSAPARASLVASPLVVPSPTDSEVKRRVRDHLRDMESSFAGAEWIEDTPAPVIVNRGADDHIFETPTRRPGSQRSNNNVNPSADPSSRPASMDSLPSGIDDHSSATSHLPSGPHTPRAPEGATTNLTAPTDTTIARRVGDIQVPASLVEEYTARGGLSASTIIRRTRNLSLREQGNTIERLSKENFDLKLKVMFLSQRLNELSEDSVRIMIEENVDIKVRSGVLQQRNKALRRLVKKLRKKLKDDDEHPDTAGGSDSDEEADAASDHEAREGEQELVYLRERVQEQTTEIERLKNTITSHGLSTIDPTDGTTVSTTTTLVDELRRKSEELRKENAELRREVGAQTSMLTSRNREKERLYQEIEELKIAQRRGGPSSSSIDTLLDRSASRAFDRPQSRDSAITREDVNHEACEDRLAEQRDKYNALRLEKQDLQQELDTCMDDFEKLANDKKQVDERYNVALNDIMVLQAERDEALQEHATLETAFEDLRKEAQEEISVLEAELHQREAEMDALRLDLHDRNDSFDALQGEMKSVSEMLVGLENDQAATQSQLADAKKTIEDLEDQLRESSDNRTRLSVQLETRENEVAFLREEQDGDKIRIGDLQASLAKTEVALKEAQEQKDAARQLADDLNLKLSTISTESKRFRKALADQQAEAAKLKETLEEFTHKLGAALGVVRGTRSSLLDTVSDLRRSSGESTRELDTTKSALAEKVRLLKHRDELLESHALELRKVSELLDKERQSHRNTKNELETFQRTNQHVSHTVTTRDSRISELEAARTQEKKRFSSLEKQYKDDLTERNKLLLTLWDHLAKLCGSDWTHNNALIDGRALPSVESVGTMLPAFSRNLLAAVKYLNTTFNHGFRNRIRNVEKDLWKEYQTLESQLTARLSKRVDRLESIVRNNVASGALGTPATPSFTEALTRLENVEEMCRRLKVENHNLRAAARARAAGGAPAAASNDGSPDGDEASPMTSPNSESIPSRIPSALKGKGNATSSSPSRIPQAKIGSLDDVALSHAPRHISVPV